MIWRDALGWPVERIIGRPYHNALRVFFQQIRGGWKQTWKRRNDSELTPRPSFADGVESCHPRTVVGTQDKNQSNLAEPPIYDGLAIYVREANMRMSGEFNAVWNAIKGWDIQREPGAGYSGATGTDVMTILVALGLNNTTSPPAGESQHLLGTEAAGESSAASDDEVPA